LLVVLVVLAFMLKKKWDKDKENAEAPPAGRDAEAKPADGTPRVTGTRPGVPGGGPVVGGPARPGVGTPGPGGPGVNPPVQPGFGGFPGFGTPAVDPAEAQRRTAERTAELTGRLAGSWRADLGNGVTQRIEYRPDGTYTDTLTGGDKARTLSGTWKVAGLVG